MIALGGVQIKAPAEFLSGAASSVPVDLFVRPERLRVGAPDETGAMAGQIVAQTYHGGHVDLQVACRACSDGLLLVRSSGDQAMIQLPPGTEVGISIDPDGCAAFPLT